MSSEQLNFSANDIFGRTVSLPDYSWEHVQSEHPEFTTWAPLIATVQAPNIVIESSRNPSCDIYYKLGAHPSYPRLYVAVVAGINADNMGMIETAHLSGNIRQPGPGGYKYVSR